MEEAYNSVAGKCNYEYLTQHIVYLKFVFERTRSQEFELDIFLKFFQNPLPIFSEFYFFVFIGSYLISKSSIGKHR